MSKLRVNCFTVSLDGYGAGSGQGLDNPLGAGGLALHEWMIGTRTFQQMFGKAGGTSGPDDDFTARGMSNVGAWILGRNMFGPVRGPWPDDSWKGWWGDAPPYHTAVFVLTHHGRDSFTMNGGTTFHFVTGGTDEALAKAREAAGGRDIRLGGGVSVIRQYLNARLIDEMHLAISPVLLGSGEHLLQGIDLPALGYTQTEHVATDKATHFVVARGQVGGRVTRRRFMGAWGYGIRQDDFVLDVIGAFEDLLKAGKSVREATETVTSRFAAASGDAVDGPLLWIAIADVQWTYGEVDRQAVKRVQEDLASGLSLTIWSDDQRGLARRRAALEKFITKIEESNPRPRKLPKTVVRAPMFSAGTCLSIHLPNGLYAAALVVAADHAHVEYGRNLVGVLDYISAEKPPLEVFRNRNWLVVGDQGGNSDIDLAWYYHTGFRAVKARLAVVGEIDILDSDPTGSNVYRPWTGIGERGLHRSA